MDERGDIVINCVTLMGRLTEAPVLKVTPSGKDVCTFKIAVDRPIVNGQRTADFITIVAWENNARTVSKYFSKGSMIAIQGSIQTRSYEDSKGNKRTAFEVVAREVHFCGSKNEGKVQQKAEETASEGINGYYANATASDFEEIAYEDEL